MLKSLYCLLLQQNDDPDMEGVDFFLGRAKAYVPPFLEETPHAKDAILFTEVAPSNASIGKFMVPSLDDKSRSDWSIFPDHEIPRDIQLRTRLLLVDA